MKKLFFAVMAVAMASVASAATDKWTFTNVDGGTLKAGYEATTVGGRSSTLLGAGYDVYYISIKQTDLAGTDAYNGRRADVAASVLESLRSGKSVFDAATAAGESVLTTTKTAANGLVTPVSNIDVDKSLYFLYSQGNEHLDALTVVMGKNDVYLATTGATTDGKTYYTPWAESDYRRDIDGTKAFTANGWYAIPEPTSGLLLLIGMAGLALRRRRA